MRRLRPPASGRERQCPSVHAGRVAVVDCRADWPTAGKPSQKRLNDAVRAKPPLLFKTSAAV